MKRTWSMLMAGFALCASTRGHAEEGDAPRPRNVLRAYTNRVQLYNVPLDMPKPETSRAEDMPDPYSTILSAPNITPNSPPATLVPPPPQRLPREKERKENWIQVTPSEDAGKPEKKTPIRLGLAGR